MSEKIIDISNTKQEYWESILSGEGLGENLSPTNSDQPKNFQDGNIDINKDDKDIEGYYFSKTNNKGCNGCNPRIMHFEGCCSREVAESHGYKYYSVEDLTDHVIYDICEFLTRNEDGIWRCENYFKRPQKCRSFECDTSIGHRIRKN
jgi:hypothetical protein